MRRTWVALGVVALLALAALAWLVGREPARAGAAAERAPLEELPEPAAGGRRPVGEPPGAASRDATPRDAASEANREGLERLAAGQLALAVERFEVAAAAAPEERVLRANLTEALVRLALEEHDAEDGAARERALARLERAARLAPERAELGRLLERWRLGAELEEAFWTDRTEHFELAFDGERDEILHGTAPLLEELEANYLELGELFGTFPVEDGRAPIRVELHRRDDFGALTGLGDWAGGAFDGTVRVPLEDLSLERGALRRVLRHELVHAFVAAVGGSDVPGWLNEGLAQWLESTQPSERAARLERARRLLGGAPPFALAELRGGLATWDDAAAIARAYAQSLALVARVEHDYGERVLVAMVEGCARDLEPQRTFADAIGLELAELLPDLALR